MSEPSSLGCTAASIEPKQTGNVERSIAAPLIQNREKQDILVDLDGPDDPGNPQNLPVARKWLIIALFSSLTVWVTFSSSVFSAAVPITAEEYHVSTEVTTLGTSLTVLVGYYGIPIDTCSPIL